LHIGFSAVSATAFLKALIAVSKTVMEWKTMPKGGQLGRCQLSLASVSAPAKSHQKKLLIEPLGEPGSQLYCAPS